jgi:hypothetical protein
MSDPTSWSIHIAVYAGYKMDMAMKYNLTGTFTAVHAYIELHC